MFKTHLQQQAEIQLATEELAERVKAARLRMRVAWGLAVILCIVAMGLRVMMGTASRAKGLTEMQRLETAATYTNYIWLVLFCILVSLCVAAVMQMKYRSLKFELGQMRALPTCIAQRSMLGR